MAMRGFQLAPPAQDRSAAPATAAAPSPQTRREVAPARLGHRFASLRIAPPAETGQAAPIQRAGGPGAVIQRNGTETARRRLEMILGHLRTGGPPTGTGIATQPVSGTTTATPNRYTGAIIDRERGGEGAVQGPLSLDAHRLLISRNLNIRSSSLNTFEQAARRLAREREADDALLAESHAMLRDPESSLSQLHRTIHRSMHGEESNPEQAHDEVLSNLFRLQQMAQGTDRGVTSDRADPVTGETTHPKKQGAFWERDVGHQALATFGLSSQSGTSGSAADVTRSLAFGLGPEVVARRTEDVSRLVHLYMRHPKFYQGISQGIATVKGSRGLEEPTPEDVSALPSSHTHSFGEIAQGVHIQSGVSSGTIDPRAVRQEDYETASHRALSLLAGALHRKRNQSRL